MTNPVWPATLPQYVNQDSYRETLTDNTIRTQMEGSATKTRRRFTKSFRKYNVSVTLTAQQKVTFDAFYQTTCKDGSLAFDWVLPAEQSSATFLFVGPPNFTAAGPALFIASFEITTV